MKMSGECAGCGGVHTVNLSVDPEVDLDAVVQLSASIDKNDNITASPELIKALAAAGVVECPNQPRTGDTLGYSNGYLTT